MNFNSCYAHHVKHYFGDTLISHYLYIGFTDNTYPIIKAFQISRLICHYINDLLKRGETTIGILSFTTNEGETSKLSHLSYDYDTTRYRHINLIFLIYFFIKYYKYQENNGLNNYVFGIIVYSDEYVDFINNSEELDD